MYDPREKKLHPHKHTLAILVHDEPGVLARIANMFMRRNFNIDNLTVGQSGVEGVSRMTITFRGDDKMYEQMTKQLNKLIDVIKVSDLPESSSVIRDLALIKVKAKNVNEQNQIMNYCHAFRARVVNISQDEMIIEIVGRPQKIDALVQLVKRLGIVEISRTGITAMARGTTFEE